MNIFVLIDKVKCQKSWSLSDNTVMRLNHKRKEARVILHPWGSIKYVRNLDLNTSREDVAACEVTILCILENTNCVVVVQVSSILDFTVLE